MPTHKRPTEPGWYWVKDRLGEEDIVEFDRRFVPPGTEPGPLYGLAVFDTSEYPVTDEIWDDCLWEGPIPPMDELDRLRRRCDELVLQVTTWQSQRAELLAALEPFARVAVALDDEPDATIFDGWDVLEGRVDGKVTAVPVPSVGDVRRAAEAYRRATRPPGGGSERGDCEGP